MTDTCRSARSKSSSGWLDGGTASRAAGGSPPARDVGKAAGISIGGGGGGGARLCGARPAAAASASEASSASLSPCSAASEASNARRSSSSSCSAAAAAAEQAGEIGTLKRANCYVGVARGSLTMDAMFRGLADRVRADEARWAAEAAADAPAPAPAPAPAAE